jgi:nucleolar protein 12
MPKTAHKHSKKASGNDGAAAAFVAVDKKAFDPNVASLFASSLGPVKPPPKSRYHDLPERREADDLSELEEGEDEEDEDSSDSPSEHSASSEEDEDDAAGVSDEEGASDDASENESNPEESKSSHEDVLAKVRESVMNGEQDRPSKKRKRANKEEEVEDVYMRKLVREELKEEEARVKKQKAEAPKIDDEVSSLDEDSEQEAFTIPKHETQTESKDVSEVEKAARTVFLGNVSSEAITSKLAKKTLLRHMGSFIEDLADNVPPHKVESLRFRSVAFGSALPKKAAFAKKEVMDATTKSTNAYVVYSTQTAAREAAKRLNGTIVLGRHLRVDSVAHPAKVDHRRCVFVGNLGFVDDESSAPSEDGEKKKKKPPSDVEEGLWVQFGKAGKVESVRVVRDAATRIGKGFAYVQFEDENGVEAALQFNDEKYPPMLPRKLRVTRARAPQRKEKKPSARPPTARKAKGAYNAKITDEQKTNQGRARAMLGKAGAYQAKESFVFEGHRASSKQGTSGLKLGGKKKKPGKLNNRSTKRAAAYKAAGGKRKGQ